jgi:hypothetical protein
MFNEVPVALKKGRAKAVRARARVILHGEKGGFYFFRGKRGYKRSGLGGAEGGGSTKEERSRMAEAGKGAPRRPFKKVCRMEALA